MASGLRLLQASIASGINVVATKVGSNKEFVDRKNQNEFCSATSIDLAEAISVAVSHPKKRLAPAHTRQQVQNSWRKQFETIC